MTQTALAHLLDRLNTLAGISDEPGRITRTFASPAMRRVNQVVAGWMRKAGMRVHEDAAGNICGRYEGTEPGAKSLLIGSHLDSVRNAGKYDGPLGVLLGIACVEQLGVAGKRLPFAIEVIGFGDEEGIRFQTTYLGSRALAGLLTAKDLRVTDARGNSLAAALRAFGQNPAALKKARRRRGDLLGYIECHIEQGPVLQERNAPVGVVTCIAGQSRLRFTFTGRAAHAGTTPMHLRKDALCAAAEFILQAEAFARRKKGLVATVGQISADPNASNVVPAQVTVSLDLRHQQDRVRLQAQHKICSEARRIARRRKLRLSCSLVQATETVACDEDLSAALAAAVRKRQKPVVHLPSGAGHDAVIMAGLTPTAMLFIRCKDGISHHPAEYASPRDIGCALTVLQDTVEALAQSIGGADA